MAPSSARPLPPIPIVYEEALFARSASAAAESRVILDLCLGDKAPQSLIDFLAGAAQEKKARD